jgi:hypothetical protein
MREAAQRDESALYYVASCLASELSDETNSARVMIKSSVERRMAHLMYLT